LSLSKNPIPPIEEIMHQAAFATDALSEVQFQLSLLQISLLGAETPQAEELELMLSSEPRNTPAQKR